ncbi:DUF3151 domain-containing protein [Agrococcus casei]|uniref:DUF3151 domain-containing protein n=2 Tax=Agrococcus TaxID=46352 RepID=A0A1R4GGC6_9MICO|nr:DUF3151 domain-containing protein [Agrococcus casei]SJM67154.1 hypothetical protein CZ674_11710 [Agrococcus casei LMG 22410]
MIGENLLGPEPTLLPENTAVSQALAHGTAPADVVRAHPESPLAWAELADRTRAEGRDVEAYAYARVGYHRGLDSLRKAGWKGAGPIPWSHEGNRGVLRCLFALREAAALISEDAEVTRLTDFLNDADPSAISELENR